MDKLDFAQYDNSFIRVFELGFTERENGKGHCTNPTFLETVLPSDLSAVRLGERAVISQIHVSCIACFVGLL